MTEAEALPANLAAEQAYLGALLANNGVFESTSYLRAEHFADPVHARIWQAAATRLEQGRLVDGVTLKADLEHAGELEEVGGTRYLAELLAGMVGIINAREYARAIYNAWVRRQLVGVAEKVRASAIAPGDGVDSDALIDQGEDLFFQLGEGRVSSSGGPVSFDRALEAALETAERAKLAGGLSGLSSGLRDFDKKTGGLHPSDLMILAGRPAMGKTALAMKVAYSAARAALEGTERDKLAPVVAIFSLEMSAEQLATRALSEHARVGSERIRRGETAQADFDRMIEASRYLRTLPVFIDDTPALTLAALRTRCRRLARRRGLALVVIDYLQLMRASTGKSENRVQEVSAITQGLKAIAKEFHVPVLALSQLSRQVESREDKRPQLSDLRESGSIEQDADSVMFIFREEYYLKQPKQTSFDNEEKFRAAFDKYDRDLASVRNRAELLLEKQRHGPTGKIDLFFEGEFTRFADLDLEHEPRF